MLLSAIIILLGFYSCRAALLIEIGILGELGSAGAPSFPRTTCRVGSALYRAPRADAGDEHAGKERIDREGCLTVLLRCLVPLQSGCDLDGGQLQPRWHLKSFDFHYLSMGWHSGADDLDEKTGKKRKEMYRTSRAHERQLAIIVVGGVS